jgi:type VI secretion system secreted protein Hcp
MPIYMNYNNIPGDVTAQGHENWIELHSFQWGVGRSISSPTSGSAGREASAPSVSDIVVTKNTDVSSTKLLNEALQGKGQPVEIDFCKTDKGKLETYLKFTLTNCLISADSFSSAGDTPTESLSLNFTRVEFETIGLGAAGGTGSTDSVTYDVAQAKVV